MKTSMPYQFLAAWMSVVCYLPPIYLFTDAHLLPKWYLCLPYLPNRVKFIFPGIIMYKSRISMMTFSKLLLNFVAESTMASLHMPVYWSSASVIFLITK